MSGAWPDASCFWSLWRLRAVGVFRKAGWPVVAFPVDYAARDRAIWDFDIDFARDLSNLNRVAHEWMGLVAYRLLGWTDEFLPSERS